MKVILLLHGLKDPHARGLLRLKSYLEAGGYKVYAIQYGFFFIVRGFLWHIFNVPIARVITAFTHILHDLGVTIVMVSHSNGSTIAFKASELGARFDLLVSINGAVERGAKLGTNTGYLLNLRIPTDPVLNISRVIAPLTPWAGLDGSLGSAGVRVNADLRMLDGDLTDIFGLRCSHAGFFSEEMVDETGPWLLKNIEHHIITTVEELNAPQDVRSQ